MRRFLPFLVLCASVSSCNQNPSPNKTMTQAEPQADWETTAKVKQAILSNSSLAAGNRLVSVTTTNGVVVLSGKVSDQDQMNQIIKTVKNVPGVKSVNNQMTLSD